MTQRLGVPLVIALLTCAVVWTSAAGQTAGTASITASPNPVPPGPEGGRTTIAWNTGDGRQGRIMLSVDGAPEMLFATNPTGRLDAPWIGEGRTYDFRLYDDGANRLLASVEVRRGLGRSPARMIAAAVVVGALVVVGIGRAALKAFRRRPAG